MYEIKPWPIAVAEKHYNTTLPYVKKISVCTVRNIRGHGF